MTDAAAISPTRFADYRWRGLVVAATVIGAWAALLLAALADAVPDSNTVAGAVLQVFVLTLLYTGLFITAHEAMHGLVAPRWPRLNHAIGRLALLLFAALPYGRMRRAHLDHHRVPSTGGDPDYHEGTQPPLLGWYVRFLAQYISPLQLAVMAGVFNLLLYGAGVPLERLLAFWIAPQVFSTWQLFVVGTWLPHRAAAGARRPFEGSGERKARSVDLPPVLSLLACFHFGYHYEHHAWPYVPWWRLPAVRGHRLPQDRADGADQPA